MCVSPSWYEYQQAATVNNEGVTALQEHKSHGGDLLG